MTSLLCLGNFGTGKMEQYDVAKLMSDISNDCKLILGLGNNIYPDGVNSSDDHLFLEKFEIPYKMLSNNIKFYNILGNKDYHLKKSPQSQINYTNKSFRWIMPHNFYCFTKRFEQVPVEFIAIDTNIDKMKNRISQEKWVINTLLESKARWRIVFGHHPWTSFGKNKENHTASKLDDLYTKLVETNKVDLIISGHDKSHQHIYIPGKPDMIISGVGGFTNTNNEYNTQINETESDSTILMAKELKFRSPELGCVKIDVAKKMLEINFFNVNKKVLYGFKIKKL
jgi:tartrate-resistant acid phosphatase type 5